MKKVFYFLFFFSCLCFFGGCGGSYTKVDRVVDSDSMDSFLDSLVAPYQKIDDEVHSRFLGVEMNYSMDDFGKILEGLGYRKVKRSYDGFFATYYGKYCGYEAF